MGSGAGSLIKLLAKNFDVVTGPVVSLAYPLYASIRAIETKSQQEDRQWLTYWILYSMITLFELTFAQLIEWIPLWSYVKLFATCWLVIPNFSGATYVYENYVRPLYINPQNINLWYIPSKKDIFGQQEDILIAAERYIQENGPDAFENLIKKANREGTARSSNYINYPSNSTTFFDDGYINYPSNSTTFSDDDYRY